MNFEFALIHFSLSNLLHSNNLTRILVITLEYLAEGTFSDKLAHSVLIGKLSLGASLLELFNPLLALFSIFEVYDPLAYVTKSHLQGQVSIERWVGRHDVPLVGGMWEVLGRELMYEAP